MPKAKKGEPRFVKGKKDYRCLTCDKEILIGERHVVFTFVSDYLRQAFRELTKYHAWAKVFEVFITLRFCSGRCYRKWKRIHKTNYRGYQELWDRVHALELSARDRRLKGWKDWKVWKEIFEPLDDRWRVYESDISDTEA